MTINEFAKNLDNTNENPALDAVNELRLDENVSTILSTDPESDPWDQW